MKFLSLLLMLYATTGCAAHKDKQIKVAVIDTGLDLTDHRFTDRLCKSGHKNYVTNEPMDDLIGHGTFVAGLIQKNAKDSNYCMVIYKYYQKTASAEITQSREIQAFKDAVDDKDVIVNFSSGGGGFSEDEATVIRDHPEVTFVVAAGNDGKNLDIPGNEYYPASLFYANMRVVGNLDFFGDRAPTSNYSNRIKYKEIGELAFSYLPRGQSGLMSGTSMACAIFSGKLVDSMPKKCNYK